MRAKLRLSFCVSAFCILHSAFLYAQAPAWWYARGVIAPGLPAHDYSPVTLGQLKWIAVKAADEMNAYFGAGPNVMAVVNAFVDSDNYIVATVGQVKYVAQPFYDRLQQFELIHTFPPGMPDRRYPWPQYSSGGDYDLATIGQVKYVFSFDSAKDSDGDGLSDWQEAADRLGLSISGYVLYSGPQSGPIHVRLSANADGSGVIQGLTLSQPGVFGFDKLPTRRWYWIKAWRDSDQNGAKDFWEAQGDSAAIYLDANIVNANITLSDPDTDNDTLPDWWEIMWFGTVVAQGPNGDPDRDLISNQLEFHFDMDPSLTTITFGNATATDNPNEPRIADTTMFFPNPGYDADIDVEHYPKHGDPNDADYASSFYLFARPSPRDNELPENEYQPLGPFDAEGSYQYNYIQWFAKVTEGAFNRGQRRSIFFEVDVFYSDFNWGTGHSDTLVPDAGFDQRILNRGLSKDSLNALYISYNITPVFVLLNGPDSYYADPSMSNNVMNHAKRFIDTVYSWKIPAAYVLGCETPGPGFDEDTANGIIGGIKDDISKKYGNDAFIIINIGVHTQRRTRIPEQAQFLAYEFSWNPWEGWSHGDGELSENNADLLGFRDEALCVMRDYHKPVHFLEYNVRVSDIPETAAYNQTWVLDYYFRTLQNFYGLCAGISRSYWGLPPPPVPQSWPDLECP